MAKISFDTVQKPMESRLLDAACIYWELSDQFFKTKRGNNDDATKRQIFYYLLKKEAGISYERITELYGVKKSTISEACEKIESHKNIYRTIAEHISQITKIAENLQSVIAVTADITLQTKE